MGVEAGAVAVRKKAVVEVRMLSVKATMTKIRVSIVGKESIIAAQSSRCLCQLVTVTSTLVKQEQMTDSVFVTGTGDLRIPTNPRNLVGRIFLAILQRGSLRFLNRRLQ